MTGPIARDHRQDLLVVKVSIKTSSTPLWHAQRSVYAYVSTCRLEAKRILEAFVRSPAALRPGAEVSMRWFTSTQPF